MAAVACMSTQPGHLLEGPSDYTEVFPQIAVVALIRARRLAVAAMLSAVGVLIAEVLLTAVPAVPSLRETTIRSAASTLASTTPFAPAVALTSTTLSTGLSTFMRFHATVCISSWLASLLLRGAGTVDGSLLLTMLAFHVFRIW